MGSALSTRLAPVHVECNKVMLTSLSMIKLQPDVCNQLSRPKKAHSASPTEATVEKEYLCETLISDSLAHQNYACFWFRQNKTSNWLGGLALFLKTVETWSRLGEESHIIAEVPKAGLTNDCCNHKLESLQPYVKCTQMAVSKHFPSHRLKAPSQRPQWRLTELFLE